MIPVTEALAIAATHPAPHRPPPVELTEDDRVTFDFIDGSLDAGVEGSFDGEVMEMLIPADAASPGVLQTIKERWEEGGWRVGILAKQADAERVHVFQLILAAPAVEHETFLSRRNAPVARIIGVYNRSGLARDVKVLRRVLTKIGWAVEVADPDRVRLPATRAALQIHLENLSVPMLTTADRNVVIPNPEFWVGGNMLPPDVEVWCKTPHALDVFRTFVDPSKLFYLGFTSLDRIDGDVPRERSFLHICGNSHRKGTDVLVRAWQPDWPALTVVAKPAPWWRDMPECAWANETHARNVRIIRDHISDDHLRELQNRSMWHIYPSRYEGYGHALWEGMSCGAMVLAPDRRPFTDMPLRLLVPVAKTGPSPSLIVEDSYINESAIIHTVNTVVDWSREMLDRTCSDARRAWEICDLTFGDQLQAFAALPDLDEVAA